MICWPSVEQQQIIGHRVTAAVGIDGLPHSSSPLILCASPSSRCCRQLLFPPSCAHPPSLPQWHCCCRCLERERVATEESWGHGVLLFFCWGGRQVTAPWWPVITALRVDAGSSRHPLGLWPPSDLLLYLVCHDQRLRLHRLSTDPSMFVC